MKSDLCYLLAHKGLKIYQDPEGFRFSVDSLLLGDFTNISPKTKKILDLCSGNGPVSLFLSLKTKAKITNLEIQKDACSLALKSIEENNLAEQISVMEGDLRDKEVLKGELFDLITCNPPFYRIEDNTNISANPKVRVARFEEMANFKDICLAVNRLLKHGGYFTFIHTPDRLSEIIDTLFTYKLDIKRIRFVHPKANEMANHVLIEAKKTDSRSFLKVLPPLYLYDEKGETSKEAFNIYNYGINQFNSHK